MKLKNNFILIFFNLKNLKNLFFVPLLVLFAFIPILNISSIVICNSVKDAYPLVIKSAQMLISVFSIIWNSFILKEYVEGDGSEILYIYQTKIFILFNTVINYFIFVFFVSLLFFVYSFFWQNILVEFIKICVICLFYNSILFCLIHSLKSTSIPIMLIILYSFAMNILDEKTIKLISVFSINEINVKNLSNKYFFLFFLSLVLLMIGKLKIGITKE